jgi:hypothetical protein
MVIRNLHHSVQQELVREYIERRGHKIRNIWYIRHRVTGNPLSLFFLDIDPEANNRKYTTQNIETCYATEDAVQIVNLFIYNLTQSFVPLCHIYIVYNLTRRYFIPS